MVPTSAIESLCPALQADALPFELCWHWSGQRELNPCFNLGKVVFYRWTTPALILATEGGFEPPRATSKDADLPTSQLGNITARGQIRTVTFRILSSVPRPVGLLGPNTFYPGQDLNLHTTQLLRLPRLPLRHPGEIRWLIRSMPTTIVNRSHQD